MPKRAYENDYPSVTTVLGVLRKIGLEMWYKWNTAKFCDEKSAKGKLIGTQLHEAIQSYIETGVAKVETEYDVEVTNALNSFMLFRKENPQYVLKRAELPLTSEKYFFNGTIDCIGEDIMWDWKSGEAKDKDKPKIYDEWKYQLSAYVNLWNEVNGANIKKAKIVVIAKDKIAYDIYEMEEEEIAFWFSEVFLSALKICNAQKRKDFSND